MQEKVDSRGENMSFEERFPSLKENKVWSKDLIGQEVFVRLGDVMDNCLDKAKTKEAIKRYCESDRGKAKDFDDFIYWIEKELNL